MKTCNWSEVFVDILLEHFLRISLHSWKYVWTLNWLWKYRYPSAKRRFLNPRHPSARNAVRSFLLTHIAYLLKWRKCIERSGLGWDTCSSLDPPGPWQMCRTFRRTTGSALLQSVSATTAKAIGWPTHWPPLVPDTKPNPKIVGQCHWAPA